MPETNLQASAGDGSGGDIMKTIALLCLTLFLIAAIIGIIALWREAAHAPYEPGWEPKPRRPDNDHLNLFREFVNGSEIITAVLLATGRQE